jgi:hypothetical protein
VNLISNMCAKSSEYARKDAAPAILESSGQHVLHDIILNPVSRPPWRCALQFLSARLLPLFIDSLPVAEMKRRSNNLARLLMLPRGRITLMKASRGVSSSRPARGRVVLSHGRETAGTPGESLPGSKECPSRQPGFPTPPASMSHSSLSRHHTPFLASSPPISPRTVIAPTYSWASQGIESWKFCASNSASRMPPCSLFGSC